MTEDLTQETVDIIVPVVTLDPVTAAPRIPVPVRHFIGEELGPLNVEMRNLLPQIIFIVQWMCMYVHA